MTEPKPKKPVLPDVADPLYNEPKLAGRQGSSPTAPSPPPGKSTVVDLPELGFENEEIEQRQDAHEDEFESAVRMAFVGAGQGGGRIAQAFFDMGYRRVCAVNTTDQDLEALTFTKKLVLGHGGVRGGAGKDPKEGETAAKESFEDIMDLMLRAWGEQVEQMYVCVGAGGGSGTGSWPVLVDAMREYCKSTNVEKPLAQHIGVIMTIPKRSEGARVQANAAWAIKLALQMLDQKKISSLILVDNGRTHELFPGLPVKKFWSVANQNFAGVLHTFNLLAAQKSEYHCVDAETEALTKRGWIKGFDLDPKDVLLTKNPDTGELEWQAMTDLKLWPDYEGPLVEFDHRTFSAVTTPDHRWLVYDRGSDEDVCKRTNELSSHHRIHRTGLYRGPMSSPWTDDFVELMGWFLTDGTCRIEPEVEVKKQKNRAYAGDWISVSLYQSKSANPEKVAQIDALLNRLGCCAHRGVYEPEARVTWRLDRGTSEVLHALFPDRTLTPEVVSTLTASQGKRLLASLMLGDGNLAGTDERQQVFTAGAEAKIDAFQMLCVLCGYASTSRWRDMSEYEPKFQAEMHRHKPSPAMTGVWNATILRRETLRLEPKHKREFQAKQPVWCPVVPNTYFVARRKGTVYVTGNTFDKADFRSIIRNGLLIFGMTRVDRWKAKEDISQAMRQNLKGTLLADGFDLSKANMAGAVVVAHDEVLQEIPMENIDYALFSLGRTLGNEGVTLHSGIYEGSRPGMAVFTVISGLEPPEARLAELQTLAGEKK
jgi:cell division GTPase FtsZ